MVSLCAILCVPLFTISSLLCIVYILCSHRFKHWKNKGVPGPTPEFPFGNVKNMLVKKIHNGQQIQLLYEQSKHFPYAGIFIFCRPTLLINDLDLAKIILVRDFNHFTDHTLPYNEKYEPLGGHLFNAKGNKWKGIRTKVSPAFTSNKMKYMFEVMAVCGESLRKYFETDAIVNADVDIKDVMAKYTTDVIVSCALGIESDSLLNPDAQFRKMGKKLMSFSIEKGIIVSLNMFAPKLIKYLPLSFTDKDVSDFFINAIYTVIQHREDNKVVRNDLMQLLIKLKNNESIDEDNETDNNETKNIQLNKLEIAAEAFGFFVAGFETSSTALSCLLYELAENPDIQNKLRSEIKDVLEEHDGKISYDALNEMNYMTLVIEETLRKYPPIPHIFRMCTKKYTIPGTNITMEEDSRIVVSVLGIHRNPDIYPEPEKFIPERFLPENKSKRHNFSFLPFGEGPRICIGMRFAMIKLRIALVSMLKNYEILHTENSKNGLKFDRRSIFMSPEGLLLKIRKI